MVSTRFIRVLFFLVSYEPLTKILAMKKLLFAFSLMLVFATACNTAQQAKTSDTLGALLELMTGSFDSSTQATADSSYYNISLHMYPIWTSREGNWLYVEQALASMQDKPYRQRIYKVEQINEMEYVSKVYRLSDEKRFIGKWQTPTYFDQFDETVLEVREGCGVFLKKLSKHSFKGATKDDDCKSTLRGASYATSIVQIEKGKITSWDQGFDAEGKQVWGAMKGGYVFVEK